jgi:hypothetical protein
MVLRYISKNECFGHALKAVWFWFLSEAATRLLIIFSAADAKCLAADPAIHLHKVYNWWLFYGVEFSSERKPANQPASQPSRFWSATFISFHALPDLLFVRVLRYWYFMLSWVCEFFVSWHNSPSEPRPPHCQGFMIALRNTTVGWTSLDEWSTRQHTTLTTDKHPCSRRDSNPQSQQASGHRPTP